MKVLVSGSRHWTDLETIVNVLSKLSKDTIIVHGDAIGVDTMAQATSEELGFPQTKRYPITKEDWVKYKQAAGPIRNKHMLLTEQPDLVIAFLDESQKSSGTKNMIELAESYGFRCIIVKPRMTV